MTDGGSAFNGVFYENLTKLMGCEHLVASPFRPQGNEINEASRQALKSMMTGMWEEGRRDLNYMLNAAVRMHNTTPHHALGISPYEVLFGRLPYFARYQDWTMVPKEEERKQILDAQLMDRLSRELLRVDN